MSNRRTAQIEIRLAATTNRTPRQQAIVDRAAERTAAEARTAERVRAWSAETA